MTDLLATLVIAALSATAVGALARRFDSTERAWAGLCLGAHVVSAPLQVWMSRELFGGGDMFGYEAFGVMLADWARFDLAHALPEIVQGALRLPSAYPFQILGGEQTATSAMTSITALLMLVTGDSLVAACAVIACGNAIGQVATYRTVRRAFPASLRPRIALALMLTPSVIFWTSGVLKEAVAMLGFAPIVVGGYLLVYERRWSAGAALVALGAVPFYVLKPYVLVGFCVAGPVLFVARRAVQAHGEVRFRPATLVAAGTLAFGGMLLFGWLFPEYSIDEFANEAAHLQAVGAQTEGGSNISVVDPGTRSLGGQLAFAPIALITSLFRPFLFEVRGAGMLIAAVESTVIVALFAFATLTQRGRAGVSALLRRSPIVLAGLCFACLLAVAIGLATTNLGTLSRYRVPIMPFWVLFLALATSRSATASAPVAADRARVAAPLPRVAPRSHAVSARSLPNPQRTTDETLDVRS